MVLKIIQINISIEIKTGDKTKNNLGHSFKQNRNRDLQENIYDSIFLLFHLNFFANEYWLIYSLYSRSVISCFLFVQTPTSQQQVACLEWPTGKLNFFYIFCGCRHCDTMRCTVGIAVVITVCVIAVLTRHVYLVSSAEADVDSNAGLRLVSAVS